MGNNSGKKIIKDPDEIKLEESFLYISNKKEQLLRSDLKRVWKPLIDNYLYSAIESYLFKFNNNEISNQTFKKFFFDLCKGNSVQKIEIMCHFLESHDEIIKTNLLKFIVSVLNSVLMILEQKVPKKYNSWSSKLNEAEAKKSINIYAFYFLNKVHNSEKEKYKKEDLHNFVNHFNFFICIILSRLYDTEDKYFYKNIIPKWKYSLIDSGKTLNQISVLDFFSIIFLNLEIPVDFQTEWRILYSSEVDGESFSRLSSQIINKGPTLIIIKDKEGFIFGAFAPVSWNFGPTFFGDSRSFLFTLHPEMKIYQATNFNDNYQYLNVGQQTMPNGLGLGGKLEYFGLWIDANYGTGYCSESCTTYRNYAMMSGSKNFQISQLEVWGVGPPLPTATELGERSVLDSNFEARAILEMAGKTTHSEGFREDVDS